MSCISIKVERIGGMSIQALRIGAMSVFASKIDAMHAKIERIGGMSLDVGLVGGMHVNVYPVCSTSIHDKYLEIEPEILWMWNAPAENNVFSNTNWNVE